MKRQRFVPAMLLTAILAVSSFFSFTTRATDTASEDITVSAAVSLKNALDNISSLYKRQKPDVSLRFNLGGSGTLMRQIEQGAPVDVFISASPEEMDALESKGMLLAGTRRDLLKNRIVLIVPAGDSAVSSFEDLDKAGVKRIAIGQAETVPAGNYAKQVLTHLGLYDRLKPKLILGKDVRQVLTYVASGNVDAGIVYATDAKISNEVKVAATASEDWHSPVIYPVAVLKNSGHATAAKDFEEFLLEPQARAAFEKYGFIASGK